MANTIERISVVETKVENLNEKLDDLKTDVKDLHDCLDKTRGELKNDLEKMYNASCSQHTELAKDLSELKKLKDKWTWMVAGALAAGGWITGHSEKIFTFFN